MTTHQAALGECRHVALVIEVAGLPEEVVADTLSAQLTAGDGRVEQGLLVGATYRGTAELRPVIETLLDSPHPPDGGRAAVFPGGATISGTTTVGELLAATRIDRVEVLGAAVAPHPATRPQYSGSGALIRGECPAT